MTTLVKHYDYYFKELADKRVEQWSLMAGPGPILAIVGMYLLSVYLFLPAYMANRKPFELKRTIQYYNVFQILACAGLIYGVLTSGWTTEYTLGCQPVDYSEKPKAVRMLAFVYWTFVLKMIELVETFFFILRKKYNQVSKLHVYHHTSTVLITWLGVKYIGGGMATFPIIINSFIHILMYTYYLLASFGPEWQKRLNKWKPRLTMAQMIQFPILIIHASTGLRSSCNFPAVGVVVFAPNIVLIFYMFYTFYKKNYANRAHPQNNNHNKSK